MLLFCVCLTACNKAEEQKQPEQSVTPTVKQSEADIDLTEMSATMVYSEVCNMVYAPEDFVGKRIKMKGVYYNFYSQDQTVAFPACVIADATACCQQGIEFVLADGKYPIEGTEVTVEGIFRAYIDKTDGETYYHLEEAELSY